MLRFLGSSHTFCDGVSRRDFLQIGAFGAGLTLADMLRLQSVSAANYNKKQPLRSNKAAIRFPGRATRRYVMTRRMLKEFRG